MNDWNGDQASLDREMREWIESFDAVAEQQGAARARALLQRLAAHARESLSYDNTVPNPAASPYINTIPPSEEPPVPGDRALERRIKNLIRWNAMAMVVRANREENGIGGHISSFASAATL
ncbi:MAG TPA: pyruvate dehydrogenase (acetyl-transferring), homodimeric type, partial [Candidatus Hydrogenedentes bacterium]|nr:pyruvate dehydrogenase (acetyl-transferring), homodimeric type [Candidatus Hydrogenedentota bacterium]